MREEAGARHDVQPARVHPYLVSVKVPPIGGAWVLLEEHPVPRVAIATAGLAPVFCQDQGPDPIKIPEAPVLGLTAMRGSTPAPTSPGAARVQPAAGRGKILKAGGLNAFQPGAHADQMCPGSMVTDPRSCFVGAAIPLRLMSN